MGFLVKTFSKGGVYMLYALCAIGGIVVGVLLMLLFRAKPMGNLLVISTHLSDTPYLCLDELEVDPNIIKKMKRITFNIIARGNSQ